jgi:hypothetical protein
MKITRGRLKEIIKEEMTRTNEGDLEMWSDDEQSSGLPQELVKSWVKELDKFVREQFAPDHPLEEGGEAPAIVAALRQVAENIEADDRGTHPGGAIGEAKTKRRSK